MLAASISRNAIALALFALVCTAIIAGTFISSADAIKENIRQAEERALLEIVPRSRHDNSMLDDAHPVDDSTMLGLRRAKQYYIARQNGEAVAVILPATAREGYTGDIDFIIGINVDGSIAGLRVLSHRETPGLGDGIDKKKSDWVDVFIDKSLTNPHPERWKVKKDHGVIDQFTGATVTPRAVTKAVLQSLQYFKQHRAEMLNPATSTATAPRTVESSQHE